MTTQAGKSPPKRQKQLACKRCRHRKQKCTDIRPCTNCTQSGSECIPSESAVPKPLLESEYVQRLEERIAQLESLIPQESLDHVDHINSAQREPRRISASASASAPGPSIPPSAGPPTVTGHERTETVQPPGTGGLGQFTSISIDTPPSLADETLDVATHGLFDVVPGGYDRRRSTVEDREGAEREAEPDLGLELELFLIQTYFDMAHSQYPVLLKSEFLQWAESWRAAGGQLPASTRWKGFFVYMVYAIAFLMTKSRINGPTRSQTFYALATSKYLSYVMEQPNTLIRAQGLLILTLHGLHIPSLETVITLSSRTIRFCVAAQLHLAETESEPTTGDEWIQIQNRRRIFWCAYAMDRVVCNTYGLPYSIADCHITTPMFDNIDDDQLAAAAANTQLRAQLLRSNAPMGISSALHIIVGRQNESEIHSMTLSKDFVHDSEEAFVWRAEILEKLKQWNRQSMTTTMPSQKGYISFRWHKMIYYYVIVMLYRPTRSTARGISGDLSVQACCQALLLFRKFQMAREIARPWLGLLTQFQIGVTLLYCLFATPPSLWPASYKSTDVPDAIRACSSNLAVLAERWAEVECIRDTFEILAKEIPLGETWERPKRTSEAGRAVIQDNWQHMSRIVIHRPTLRMIHEMASDDFVDVDEVNGADGLHDAAAAAAGTDPDIAAAVFDGMDLQWAHHPMHASLFGMDAGVYLGNEMEGLVDDIHFRE